MRCRKARSLLSAASSEELGARQLAAVREHVASCAACRREEAYYKSIRQATHELPAKVVSEDFNTRLLNRIAEERFAETRTRAYQPKAAPRFGWRLLAPVVATTALLAVVAISLYTPGQQPLMGPAYSAVPESIDDSYLTVQPVDNPNLTVGLKPNWALDQELARAEKMELISRQLTNQNGFGNMHLTGSRSSQPFNTNSPMLIPRSIFRFYQVNGGGHGGEADQVY